MPLKPKTNQQTFEFESQDGDKYKITYLRTKEQRYVQIEPETAQEGPPRYDVDMLLELSDSIRALEYGQAMASPATHTGPEGPVRPDIQDHRSDDTETEEETGGDEINLSPSQIQSHVDESMDKMDDSGQEAESLSPVPPIEVIEEVSEAAGNEPTVAAGEIV
jgi:hypothetical protein